MIFLGFDTSNYTTSVASIGDADLNIRKILEVEQGQRGLRQSDALFQHIKQLPVLFNELSKSTNLKQCAAIGVSTRPRNVDGSYMPVFLAGEGYSKVIADTLGVPLYEFSHQDGHIMAGIASADAYELLDDAFISVHLSGGTCEILKTEYKNGRFICEIIGGSKDISAGQLIDRVGVAMGLSFPCGKELEKISLKAKNAVGLPVSTNGSYINFSGIETKALSLMEKENNENLALGILQAIAKALEKTLTHCIQKENIKKILIVGGVASNSIIKNILKNNLDADLFFASPELSCDNAYGIALLTKMLYNREFCERS